MYNKYIWAMYSVHNPFILEIYPSPTVMLIK